MNFQRFALPLLMAFGCAPEEIVESGDHIRLEIEAGLTPCGDLVGHMDRFLELVAEAWQVDLEGQYYTFRWYTPETFWSESDCGTSALGCAGNDTVRSMAAPHDHELVHLVSSEVGRPPSFFVEGAAVAFELPAKEARGLPSTLPIIELLTASTLPGRAYLLAGAYTRHLIDRFGMSAYLAFYEGLAREADLETIAAVHLSAFGEPLEASIAAFDAERRDCEHERFRFKLIECAAPALAWTGDTLRLRRDISCADDDVVGPFYPVPRARAHASFEIVEAGLFELSAASDSLSVTVTLGSCGGCESAAPVTLQVGGGPQRLVLEAGPYYLRLDAPTSEDTLLSLVLRRIE